MFELSRKELGVIKADLIKAQGGKCTCGKGTTHLGRPLEFRIDWIDGNKDNKKDDNLIAVCQNCFAVGEVGLAELKRTQDRYDANYIKFSS